MLVAADDPEHRSLDYHGTLERTKEELILRAFEQADRDHSEAARPLGVHPHYVHRLLRNLNLRPRLGSAPPSTKS
jgi:ActR/RegA family two-component response regulator